MTSLTIAITPGTSHRRIRIEFDADRLERVAASLGLYNPEFVASIERAEEDYVAGRVRSIKSLADLRKRKR